MSLRMLQRRILLYVSTYENDGVNNSFVLLGKIKFAVGDLVHRLIHPGGNHKTTSFASEQTEQLFGENEGHRPQEPVRSGTEGKADILCNRKIKVLLRVEAALYQKEVIK